MTDNQITAAPAALIRDAYLHTHRLILKFLHGLADEQLYWQLTPAHHPIAFHAWHVARWADYFQASVPGMTPSLTARMSAGVQYWDAAGLAANWGFAGLDLGFMQTGMDMPDAVAVALKFPTQTILLDYVDHAFAAAEQVVSAIDDEQFNSPEQSQPMTQGIWVAGLVGGAVLSHVTHASRHLGMMEALLGMQGGRGTATR